MRGARTLVLCVAAAAAAACATGTDERPPVAPGGEALPAARAVDPAVEAWFRSRKPGAAGRLIAGDRIRIEVQGKGDYSVTRDVPPDGRIPLYRSDKVLEALGRTTQELEADVAAAYGETFERPYVTVRVEAPAPRSIYVSGAVKEPNRIPITGTDRLTVLQAVVMAGGHMAQADLRNVTIRRIYPPTGEMVASPPLDILAVMERADERDNLAVEPGDTIVVPEARELSVQVLGHVEKPGPVAWYKGITLSRAITECGGFQRFAKKGAIKVVRKGTELIVFDFDAMLDGRLPDLVLEPRDVVWVDEKWI